MPPYILTKNITPRKKSPFRIVANVLLLIIAVPVVAIAFVSLLLFFAFMWLRGIIINKELGEANEEIYHLELELLNNPHVKILLVEDELDAELTALNNDWTEKVYNKETCLYRAKTVPAIREINGRVCCFYLKEYPEGAILQVLNSGGESTTKSLDTSLMFLRYPDLQITVIGETGPYFLYNDKKDNRLIQGFNDKEAIRIVLAD